MPLFQRSGARPANRLEELLRLARTDPKLRREFYSELLRSQITVVGDMERPDGKVTEGWATTTGGEKLNAVPIKDTKGRLWVPLFTSYERLQESLPRRSKTQPHVVTVVARDLLGAFPSDTCFVLNPGSDFWKALVPEEVHALLSGKIFEVPLPEEVRIPAGAEYFKRPPPNPPEPLMQAMRQFFASEPTVMAAYISEIHVPSQGTPPHLMIEIRFSSNPIESMKQLLPRLSEAIVSVTGGAEIIDVVPLQEATIASTPPSSTMLLFSRGA